MVKLTRLAGWLISYLAPYQNAVSVTLDDVLDSAVSVLSFGAKGDGVTDDTAAIQKAVNSGCKHVVFPSGRTFRVPSGFSVDTDGVTLSMTGSVLSYGPSQTKDHHCIRVTGDNVTIKDVGIECDPGLVRNDTGFGISLYQCVGAKVLGGRLVNIASAGIWHTDTKNTEVTGVTVLNGKADGIHVADGCTNFIIGFNIVQGCHDDHIAVVSDVPADGRTPRGGVVTGNLCTDGVAGHGCCLIGCEDVIVSGNTFRGMAWPGVGCYFWQTVGQPADEDWVHGCQISDNVISACGLNPTNSDNATGMFLGAIRNSRVFGNTIQAAPAFTQGGTPGNCILLANVRDVSIEGNYLHDSVDYGICTRDALGTGSINFTGLSIVRNTFNNIATDFVHIAPTNTIGSISVLDNTLLNTPVSSSFGRSMYISRTGSNRLTIAGNKGMYSQLPYAYDATTCTNVVGFDNKPEMEFQYTPNISSTGGAISATGTGKYTRRGDTVFLDLSISVTGFSGSVFPVFALPFPAKDTRNVMCVGRQSAGTGKLVVGNLLNNQSTVILQNYDNSAPLSGSTGASTFQVSVQYVAA